MLQSEALLCKESRLNLVKRHIPGNSLPMGACVEHDCLECDIFLSGKFFDVSPDTSLMLQLCGVPELAIGRPQDKI